MRASPLCFAAIMLAAASLVPGAPARAIAWSAAAVAERNGGVRACNLSSSPGTLVARGKALDAQAQLDVNFPTDGKPALVFVNYRGPAATAPRAIAIAPEKRAAFAGGHLRVVPRTGGFTTYWATGSDRQLAALLFDAMFAANAPVADFGPARLSLADKGQAMGTVPIEVDGVAIQLSVSSYGLALVQLASCLREQKMDDRLGVDVPPALYRRAAFERYGMPRAGGAGPMKVLDYLKSARGRPVRLPGDALPELVTGLRTYPLGAAGRGSIVADPAHGLLLLQSCCAGRDSLLVRSSNAKRLGFEQRDLSHLQTALGIRIGTPAETVTRLLGEPLSVRDKYGEGEWYLYGRSASARCGGSYVLGLLIEARAVAAIDNAEKAGC